MLEALVPEPMRVPRAVVDTGADAAAFLEDALARGHEGVMVKALTEPYAAGGAARRWLKVKPRHTLDLVVLAAEWGHGRRRGLALEPAPRRPRAATVASACSGRPSRG